MIVAQELKKTAMELVGARTQFDVDVCACIAAVLRSIVARLHLEFLYGINGWVEVHEVVAIIHGGDAVDIHLHPDIARAIGEYAGALRIRFLAHDDARGQARKLQGNSGRSTAD